MPERLPPDSPWNKRILTGKIKDCKIYFGSNKWGRKEWMGRLYPKGIMERDFLQYYATHFNSVELVASHYDIPTPEQVANWLSKVENTSFLFCPKIPKRLSKFHYWNYP